MLLKATKKNALWVNESLFAERSVGCDGFYLANEKKLLKHL